MPAEAEELGALADAARAGDPDALAAFVDRIRDDVYNLAIRMLWHPEDAEDASQEILVRVITHLGGFRGEADVRTWVYRVASNHLLTMRKRRAEDPQMSFEEFGEDLAVGSAAGPTWKASSPERRLEIEEVKIGCSQAMLLCLDREHRLAFILGEIVELSGSEGASVLGISEVAFRKRLSRARERVFTFLRARCGLADDANPCRCHRRVERARELGRMPSGSLLFADHPAEGAPARRILAGKRATEDLRLAVADIQRSNPRYRAPERLVERMRELLQSERFRVLAEDP